MNQNQLTTVQLTLDDLTDVFNLTDDKGRMYAYIYPVIKYIASDRYQNEVIDALEITVIKLQQKIIISLSLHSVMNVIEKYLEWSISIEDYEKCAELVHFKKIINAKLNS